MTEIRQAISPEDFSAARTLFREYADSLTFGLGFQDFEEELAGLPGDYSSPGGCVLIAVVEGGRAGCVALRPLSEGICEMKRLYVRDAFRGCGVGRALAEAVIARAEASGYVHMRLDTVSTMLEANALYLSLGFREIPSYRHNPLEGARFFELSIDGR